MIICGVLAMSAIGAKSFTTSTGEIIGDRVDDLGAPLADQQGVAVRLGARDPGDADRAAGAADILDDDRLAERRLQGA